MSKITIKRISQSDNGTFGVMLMDGMPLCVTLEDPWNNNERNISCIPAGRYPCTKHNGTKYKDVWILGGVPDRSAILIHAGNSTDDTQGCILVGRSFNAHTIRDSRNALDYLRAVLPDQFDLEVINEVCPKLTAEPSTFEKLINKIFKL